MIGDMELKITGQQDINGREIYEGDIVRATVINLDEKTKIIAPVIWISKGKIKGGEGFYIGCWVDDGNYSLFQFEDVKGVEVIGNVRNDTAIEKLINRTNVLVRQEVVGKIRKVVMKYKGEYISVQTLLKILWRCQNEGKK